MALSIGYHKIPSFIRHQDRNGMFLLGVDQLSNVKGYYLSEGIFNEVASTLSVESPENCI